MSDAARRRLEPEDRRDELTARGLELFGRLDYHALSSSALAKHAGVSRALLHHYFGSKRGYYLASLQRAAEQFMAQLEPDRSRAEPDRTREGLTQYVRYARDNAVGYSALMRSGFAADPEFGERVEEIRRIIVGRVQRSVRVAAGNVVFAMAIRAWLAEIESLCLSWLQNPCISEAELVSMLMRSRDAALRNAAVTDPEAGADLEAAGVQPGL